MAAAAHLAEAYAACVRYIFSNADFSSAGRRYQKPVENWRRFDALLEKLGRPLQHCKVVHIAGTNGKGTTSALCDAMLRASGKRVGIFTSPHLHSFRERIRVDGKLVSKEAVVAAMDKVRPAVEAVGDASPFEKLSALAFVCFARAEVEWAVLETGLGGRWDCTNHCEPVVCGITRIGLDHMNVLGSTVAAIAAEKAGIIKKGVPAFCVLQDPTAAPVLQARASEVGTELQVVHEDVYHDSLPFWLSPAHQRMNAALASSLMHSLAARGLIAEERELWQHACETLFWPARFEVFAPNLFAAANAQEHTPPSLILDVAHNVPSVQALLSSVSSMYCDAPLVVIFGANRDKDVKSMVQLITNQPQLRMGVAVLSSHPKGSSVDEIISFIMLHALFIIQTMLPASGKQPGRCWRHYSSPVHLSIQTGEEALCYAADQFFVAADMRATLADVEPELFDPADWVFENRNEPHLLM